ncbi:hypothetical protein C0J52_15025 [Blattella germanica]|nr:hypothetical protein C0J52_15025 [Blattella germanica]
MSDHERIRLVILGGAGVGKSCIVKKFLFNTFTDKYRSTVEDLYNREYDLGPVTLKVDILDTAGDMQFPAMRRLSIATAHAFLLVYATTSAPSFESVKRCFEEVREQRADFQDIPMVVAGNKLDLASIMECSAKDDYNIKEIFRCFLTLSRILPAGGEDSSGGLKRRSSAYVSASSKNKGARRTGSPALEPAGASASASSEGATGGLEVTRSKPRSRSLIRRSSRKAKQQMRDAHDDCID